MFAPLYEVLAPLLLLSAGFPAAAAAARTRKTFANLIPMDIRLRFRILLSARTPDKEVVNRNELLCEKFAKSGVVFEINKKKLEER